MEVVAGYRTSYLYDSVDNLTTVTQGVQTRRFAYDSLKRLIFAANPEQDTSNNSLFTFNAQQWAIKYDYDENSNLKFKTDTRLNASSEFVKVTYIYDALNRVKTRSYNDGTPEVTYKYDGTGVTGGVVYSKGKLTLVSSTVSAYSYDEYDPMGRVKRCTQTTGGQAYQMGYGYDLAGNMTSETYPSGKVIATEYDAAGRIAGVKRQANGMYYAGGPAGTSAMIYAAHGAVASMRLGNGRIERTTFNNRLQPVQISLDSNTVGVNTLQLDYGYGTTTNNGNVLSQTITVPKSAGGNLVLTQNYAYDALNRLGTAEELIATASQWKQTYDYDRWGNRAVRNTPTSTYIPNPRLTPISNSAADLATLFIQTTNRITASTDYGYDNAGNLTSMPNKVQGFAADTMGYDAENHQIKFNSTTQNYFYDGDGRRVKKIVGNDTTVFVYNVAGQLIAEYTSGTPAAGDTSYLTTDHLGSTRLVTDSGGNVKARYDYLPFGEEIPPSVGNRLSAVGYGGADSTKQKFTQYERDTESGLDFAHGRYYSNSQGRFTSFDRLYESAKTALPQSWNRYAYCLNNPLVYTDPSGLLWWMQNGSRQPVWFESLPIDEDGYATAQGWTVVQDFVYDAGDEGWVTLDPGSNSFAQFDTEGEAREAYGALTDSGASYNVLDSALEMSMLISAVGAIKGVATLSAEELAAGAADLAARRALQLSLNKIAGREAELLVKEQLEAAGYKIVGSRVGARTADGMLRVIDHLVETPAGELQAIEVKAGGAVRNSYQLSQDAKMANEGATIVGKNARELRGRTLPKLETVERRVP